MSLHTRVKIQAFFDEFPWLDKYLNPGTMNIDSIQVERVDFQVLQIVPCEERKYHGGNEAFPGEYDYVYFGSVTCFLIRGDGDTLRDVRPETYRPHPNFRRWNPFSWGRVKVPGEGVIDALWSLADRADEVEFVLRVWAWRNSRREQPRYEITIYKRPKVACSLPEWIKSERERARQAVRDRLIAVDV